MQCPAKFCGTSLMTFVGRRSKAKSSLPRLDHDVLELNIRLKASLKLPAENEAHNRIVIRVGVNSFARVSLIARGQAVCHHCFKRETVGVPTAAGCKKQALRPWRVINGFAREDYCVGLAANGPCCQRAVCIQEILLPV
jgi:hypothetical protein